MVFARHPDVATLIIQRMRDPVLSARTWHSSWSVLKGSSPLRGELFASSQRPPRREPEDYEPRGCRHDWQLEAASQVER